MIQDSTVYRLHDCTAMPPALTWSRWCLTHSESQQLGETAPKRIEIHVRSSIKKRLKKCHIKFLPRHILPGEDWKIISLSLRAVYLIQPFGLPVADALHILYACLDFTPYMFKPLFYITTTCKYTVYNMHYLYYVNNIKSLVDPYLIGRVHDEIIL